MKCIWRLNDQNYNFALVKWYGNDMRYNVS